MRLHTRKMIWALGMLLGASLLSWLGWGTQAARLGRRDGPALTATARANIGTRPAGLGTLAGTTTLMINPASNNAWAVTELINAITTANGDAAADTINLFPGGTYTFTAANNFRYGPNALPQISSNITIEGQGATLQIAAGTTRLRFFYVGANPAASGTPGFHTPGAGNLTLRNLTLRGGRQKGGDSNGASGGAGMGGALFNQGVLQLEAVTLTDNRATGGNGGNGGGGGGGLGSDASGGNGGGFGGPVIPVGSSGGTAASGGGGGGGFGPGDTGGSGSGGNGGAGGGTPDGLGGIGSTGSGGGGNPSGGGFGGGGGGGGGLLGGGGGGLGGAIFNHRGTLNLINSTLSGNTAQGGTGDTGAGGGSGLGAALFNLNGTVTLNFSTLAKNIVTAGAGGAGGSAGQADGGALYNLAFGNKIEDGTASTATVTVRNSILANSTGGNDLVNDKRDGSQPNTATVDYDQRNIVMTKNALSGTAFTGTLYSMADPQLGMPTTPVCKPAVLPINNTSPAFNNAVCDPTNAPTDECGTSRPQGAGCDIGAYELPCQTITATVSGGGTLCPGTTGTVTVTLSGGFAPYTVTLTNGGGTLTGNSPLSFTINAPGTYSVASGTDAVGCPVTGSGSATFSADTTAPTIACNNVTAQMANANSSCQATVPDVTGLVRAQSADNCTTQANLTVTQNPVAGSAVSGTGAHPIVVTA